MRAHGETKARRSSRVASASLLRYLSPTEPCVASQPVIHQAPCSHGSVFAVLITPVVCYKRSSKGIRGQKANMPKRSCRCLVGVITPHVPLLYYGRWTARDREKREGLLHDRFSHKFSACCENFWPHDSGSPRPHGLCRSAMNGKKKV